MPPADQLTVGFSYYQNPANLQLQLAALRAYPARLWRRLHFVIVDDGSPAALTLPAALALNLTAYRIRPDIPFNYGGAKNLVFDRAATPWVLITDIDHVVDAGAAARLLDLDLSDERVVYTFARRFPAGPMSETRVEVRAKPAIPATLLINRRVFWEAGGYDEDFSGHYGKDDSLLKWHLVRNHGCRLVQLDLALLCYACVYRDAPSPPRDVRRNARLFAEKTRAPAYHPGPPLRFDWVETYRARAPAPSAAPARPMAVHETQ